MGGVNMFANPGKAEHAAYRPPDFSRAAAGYVRVNPGQREHQLCADLPVTGWRLGDSWLA